MKNGTKSPDDKKRKTKKQKEANDNAPMAKAPPSEAKTVSEAKPVMRRVQAAAPMPQAKAVVASKPVKAASALKSNGKANKDVKKDAKKASKSAKSMPGVELPPFVSAFKPPFAVANLAMPKAMMAPAFAEAGQGALAVNRKLVEMAQANVRSGLDFALRLSTAKTPMEFMSLQVSYWHERMGALARQAEELRELAGIRAARGFARNWR